MSPEELGPKDDEAELSLLGPGYGESVVIHLGYDMWVVVDSCRDRYTKSVAPLAYLDGLGVDIATKVVLVVATHWHDDHVAGISEVIAAAENAKFVCSAAIGPREVREGIGRAGGKRERRLGAFSSGVEEMYESLRIASDKRKPDESRYVHFSHAGDDLLKVITMHHPLRPTMAAWSPSDKEVFSGYKSISGALALGRTGRIPEPDKNDAAIVLSVATGSARMLLGSDLEVAGTDRHRGWEAVLSMAAGSPPASIFKVPHHGAENGHHIGVWQKLLEQKPHAALTPWENGGRYLPTADDMSRLSALSSAVHITAPPGPSVLKDGRKRRWREAPVGRVTLRRSLAQASDWIVHYNNGAFRAS